MTVFNYKPEEIQVSPSSKRTKIVWRPILPIILMRGKKFVGYEALIDSGADYNIFHGEIAEILDIRLTSGKKRKILGISGEAIKGYVHNVEIKPFGMKSFFTKVIFSNQIPEHALGVLGNDGFFDKYIVNFDYKKKRINLL